MYLNITNGKDPHFYILQGFRKKEGGTSSKIYLNLVTASEIKERYGCTDAHAWAKSKLKEINDAAREDKASVIVTYNLLILLPDNRILRTKSQISAA